MRILLCWLLLCAGLLPARTLWLPPEVRIDLPGRWAAETDPGPLATVFMPQQPVYISFGGMVLGLKRSIRLPGTEWNYTRDYARQGTQVQERSRFRWFKTQAYDGLGRELNSGFQALAGTDLYVYEISLQFADSLEAQARSLFLDVLGGVSWLKPAQTDAVLGLPFRTREAARAALLPAVLAEYDTQDPSLAPVQDALNRKAALLVEHAFSFVRCEQQVHDLWTGRHTLEEIWRDRILRREAPVMRFVSVFAPEAMQDGYLYHAYWRRSWEKLLPLGKMSPMMLAREEMGPAGGVLWYFATHPESWQGQDSILLAAIDWQVSSPGGTPDTSLVLHHQKIPIPFDGYRTRVTVLREYDREQTPRTESPFLILTTFDARHTWVLSAAQARTAPVYVPEMPVDTIPPEWIARNCGDLSDTQVSGNTAFPALWAQGKYADSVQAVVKRYRSEPPPTSQSGTPGYQRQVGEWRHTIEHGLRATLARQVIPTRRLYVSQWMIHGQYMLRFQVRAGRLSGVQVMEQTIAGPVLLPSAPPELVVWLRQTRLYAALVYESTQMQHHLLEW